ncbi:uncharacterized protein LOC110435906 [Sorghum bicolor]|uniref:uncharacterized protein LOC110435906 n=1 Tax=Sorghum bicolor TaxID=4558 RepID=UPI000B4266B9|nr:uncharacterized protein LOC110435906 [Sorghum bicolor]|eukprot:XP_021317683.1 uncharacterized protein LOC110435906 [Sorghum bicolor]
MAPGKKQKSQKPTSPPREPPLTDIEIKRMQNIIENNRLFQRLGLVQLRQMVNAKPIGAAKPMRAASEYSGSLYEPEDEDIAQEAVDKEAMLDLEPLQHEISSTLPKNIFAGSRTSKRVTARPEEQSQPVITRKRARELLETAEDSNVAATDLEDGASDQELIVANADTQSDSHNMTRQDPCREKRRMGRGLERISRGFDNKIKLHIAPGNKRPEAPMQAAKLASKAGIFIRGRIPIFPHWKDYKDPNALEIMNDYMKNIGVSAQLVFSFALH